MGDSQCGFMILCILCCGYASLLLVVSVLLEEPDLVGRKLASVLRAPGSFLSLREQLAIGWQPFGHKEHSV